PQFSHSSYTPTSPTDTYPLSLHDALPIYPRSDDGTLIGHDGESESGMLGAGESPADGMRSELEAMLEADGSLLGEVFRRTQAGEDRKSTRLNSSHEWISYAVFCLKKKI